MCFSIEYSCHTITNIIHGRRLSLQLMTNLSLTCNYSNACLVLTYHHPIPTALNNFSASQMTTPPPPYPQPPPQLPPHLPPPYKFTPI